MPEGALSDEEIVGRVLRGDADLFEVLVDRHRDRVFELLSRRLPAAEVPAVAQDVFVSAWLSLPRFQPRAPFARWLTRLALRRCHDHWRRRYAGRELGEAGLLDVPDDVAARAADRREDGELLQLLLSRLPPDDRAVLTLLVLDERSVAEVAELLEWSADKVKTRAHRARRRLRELAAQAAAAGRPW